MALFKTTHEQREAAFVRNRLKERKNFDRPDIEAWLQQQRTAEEPAMLFPTPWQDFIARIGDNIAEGRDRIVTLVSNASTDVLHPRPKGVNRKTDNLLEHHLSDLLSMIDWTKVRMYLGDACIVLNKCGSPVVFYVHNQRLHQTDRLSGENVADVLLATWRRKKPTWQDARLVLCNLFDLQIQRVKNEVRSDFDRAVAVTDDGQKIVHATKVVVYDWLDSGPSNIRIYDPAQFRSRKILYNPHHCARSDAQTVADAEKQAMGRFNVGSGLCWSEQCLVKSKVNDTFIFVTHAQYCPDPLPEPMPAPVTA